MGFGEVPPCHAWYAVLSAAFVLVIPAGIDVAMRAASSMMMLAVPSPLSSAMYTASAYVGGLYDWTFPSTYAFLFLSRTHEAKSTVTDWLFVVAVMKASSPATKAISSMLASRKRAAVSIMPV